MNKFFFKQLIILFCIVIIGTFINNYLFHNIFFGELEGVILSFGAFSFFFFCIALTIFFFRVGYFIQLFQKRKPVQSRDELYEKERNSRLNYMGIVSSVLVGILYGIIFAIFYKEIDLKQGVFAMGAYGAVFGVIMYVLVKIDWFSYHAFAKESDY
ncbi:hypothetical protein GYB29_13165 [bacterium]|nr:hypothetical protein [bacterium]